MFSISTSCVEVSICKSTSTLHSGSTDITYTMLLTKFPSSIMNFSPLVFVMARSKSSIKSRPTSQPNELNCILKTYYFCQTMSHYSGTSFVFHRHPDHHTGRDNDSRTIAVRCKYAEGRWVDRSSRGTYTQFAKCRRRNPQRKVRSSLWCFRFRQIQSCI